jgi:hypothetical protein
MIIVIGLMLGLIDQRSAEVSGTLRFPALIAALILVGQGLNRLNTVRAREIIKDPDTVVIGGPGSSGAVSVNRGVEPGVDEGGSTVGARLVLVLAVWLGIASLSYPSGALTVLSLLAAFLLFARGWNVVAAA